MCMETGQRHLPHVQRTFYLCIFVGTIFGVDVITSRVALEYFWEDHVGGKQEVKSARSRLFEPSFSGDYDITGLQPRRPFPLRLANRTPKYWLRSETQSPPGFASFGWLLFGGHLWTPKGKAPFGAGTLFQGIPMSYSG